MLDALQPASAWGAALAGALLGVSLAAPPGPIIAVMANESIRGRIRRSMAMALGAMTGDAVWLLTAVVGFVAFLESRPRLVGGLGLVGAGILLRMAWLTWKAARSELAASRGRGTFKLGLATALTSPYSFAWWLANGALLLSSWGWPGIAGMFVSLFVYSLAISYAFRWIGGRVESAVHVVAHVGAVMLFGFGLYFGAGAFELLSKGGDTQPPRSSHSSSYDPVPAEYDPGHRQRIRIPTHRPSSENFHDVSCRDMLMRARGIRS